ncbi:hypothetical protein ACFL43_05615 [Thermodesulfobacteriota bacterium]
MYVLDNNTHYRYNLRRFRDEILKNSFVGNNLIQLCYENDKKIKETVGKSPAIKKVIKKTLELLMPAVEVLLE